MYIWIYQIFQLEKGIILAHVYNVFGGSFRSILKNGMLATH